MNNDTNHSPVPWRSGSYTYGETTDALAVWGSDVIPGERGKPVCLISPLEKVNDRDKANAKLIAAAPDLLDAAFEAMATLDIISPGDHRKMKALSALRAAIKKAGAE